MTERRCSFCEKVPPAVKTLIGGPGAVAICEECVGLCVSILNEAGVDVPAVINDSIWDVGGGWRGTTASTTTRR